MKLECDDALSNQSDFSNDSQNSQMSTTDFISSMATGMYSMPNTFLNLGGLHSGVPTPTTPTLTPTTLRNIEQTFSELQPKPEPHENEAGFVPPSVHSIGNNQYVTASEADIYFNNKSDSMWHSSVSQSSSDCDTRSTPPPVGLKTTFSGTTSSSGQSRRNMGGRKPTKDLNISPEEEERRRIRRERNKAAAARCRKRRVDHTNALIKETEELEAKRQALQDELCDLQTTQEELTLMLKSHPNCRKQSSSPADIKPFTPQPMIYESIIQNDRLEGLQQHHHHHQNLDNVFLLPNSPSKKILLSSTVPISKPSRPNSLNVGATAPHLVQSNNNNEINGVQISTPSKALSFNYESLMLGGTGLTPVACGAQQRHTPVSNNADLSSPDAKLVSL